MHVCAQVVVVVVLIYSSSSSTRAFTGLWLCPVHPALQDRILVMRSGYLGADFFFGISEIPEEHPRRLPTRCPLACTLLH